VGYTCKCNKSMRLVADDDESGVCAHGGERDFLLKRIPVVLLEGLFAMINGCPNDTGYRA
jgi:hypothetical protein